MPEPEAATGSAVLTAPSPSRRRSQLYWAECSWPVRSRRARSSQPEATAVSPRKAWQSDEAELFQGLGRFTGPDARLEMGARFFPGPAFEGVGAGGEIG